MIKIRLAEIAESKGHTRSTLSKAADISYPTILLFWNNTVQKVDLDILDRLCIFLECKPCDIMEFTPTSQPVSNQP